MNESEVDVDVGIRLHRDVLSGESSTSRREVPGVNRAGFEWLQRESFEPTSETVSRSLAAIVRTEAKDVDESELSGVELVIHTPESWREYANSLHVARELEWAEFADIHEEEYVGEHEESPEENRENDGTLVVG